MGLLLLPGGIEYERIQIKSKPPGTCQEMKTLQLCVCGGWLLNEDQKTKIQVKCVYLCAYIAVDIIWLWGLPQA